jgi:hypothetical protein
MLALVLPKLFDLRRMAGEAGFGQWLVEGDHQRRVRILVTGEAGLKLEVRFSLMALAADGDIVLRGRPVAGVAILAIDRGFVLAALGRDIRGLAGVAFRAIAGTEIGVIAGPRRNSSERYCADHQEKQKPDRVYSFHCSSIDCRVLK